MKNCSKNDTKQQHQQSSPSALAVYEITRQIAIEGLVLLIKKMFD